MLGKVGIISMVVALLTSPTFASWQPVEVDQLDTIAGQRIITESVVNGGLTQGASDATPASELHPVSTWTGERSALDRQQAW